jgi:uncharacterized protein (DUF488 family)
VSMAEATLYSVGHSNRALAELLTLLQEVTIATLVDVRAEPRSRHNPQFNEDALREACTRAGINYHWAGRMLGGLRVARADSPHIALDAGLRGFADHMQTDGFKKGAAQLLAMAARAPTAFLCAERLPEHCHRSLIADHLLLQGAQVLHLIKPGESRGHVLNPAARYESAALIYDRATTAPLDWIH